MDTCRLRVKIGPYEMEAEGPRDFVEKHYGSFSEKIPQPNQLATVPKPQTPSVTESNDDQESQSTYASIFRVEGRFVTLTAKPIGDDQELDGLLLILLGHKEMRGADNVSADELLYGMKQSGFGIDRTDRLAIRAEAQSLITRTGVRRGTRYRLTNPGIEKARKVADETVAMVGI